MNHCTDKNQGRLLHAYELGLLSEREREQFELHLYECEDCFSRASKLEGAVEALRTSKVIHREIARAGTPVALEKSYSAVGRIIRVGFPMAAVIVILLLSPWRLKIDTGEPAIAGTERLAVLPFENLADPADSLQLGEMLADLLAADLGESRTVSVEPGQRIRDIIRDRKTGSGVLTRSDMRSSVIAGTGASWILLGTILETSPTIRLAVQISGSRTGEVKSSLLLESKAGEDWFAVANRLSTLIEEDFASVIRSVAKDYPTTDMTTPSLEAYGYYMRGMECQDRYDLSGAAEAFARAVALDTAFAMAWYYLSYYPAAYRPNESITLALRHLNNASRMDQHYIRSRAMFLSSNYDGAVEELRLLVREYPLEKQAWVSLGGAVRGMGRWSEAIDYLRVAVSLDTSYRVAYNDLAYAYAAVHDFDRAVEAANKYVSLAPQEPNPYDTKGEILALAGRVEEAQLALQQALALDSNYCASRLQLAAIGIMTDRLVAAKSQLSHLLRCTDLYFRSQARYLQALIALRRGRFAEALDLLDSGIVADTIEQNLAQLVRKRFQKALILSEVDGSTAAVDEIRRCLVLQSTVNPEDKLSYHHFLAQVLAQAGELDAARMIADDLKSVLGDTELGKYGYNYAMGWIEIVAGAGKDAARHFDDISEAPMILPPRFPLAVSLLKSGNAYRAEAELERLLSSYDLSRLNWCIWDVKAHYYLGLAFEQTGQIAEAIRELEKFVTIWREADRELAELTDARARLDKLRTRP